MALVICGMLGIQARVSAQSDQRTRAVELIKAQDHAAYLRANRDKLRRYVLTYVIDGGK
jgi:hypothetical protein